MCLLIISESFNKMVKFNTNSDFSWIVNPEEVVRSQYGSVRVEDRNQGYYRIPKGNKLVSGQSLLPGQCISSENGDYDLIYQTDGNAVIYKRDKPAGQAATWSSQTDKNSAGKLILQEDGNFVIYDANAKAVAATNQFGQGFELVMQDDGNLVLQDKDKKVLWDTMHVRTLAHPN